MSSKTASLSLLTSVASPAQSDPFGLGAISEPIFRGREVSLTVSDTIVAYLQKERSRLSTGVSRESNIALAGFFLTAMFAVISPFLAIFGIPILAYGLYTYSLDSKKLKAMDGNLDELRQAIFETKT